MAANQVRDPVVREPVRNQFRAKEGYVLKRVEKGSELSAGQEDRILDPYDPTDIYSCGFEGELLGESRRFTYYQVKKEHEDGYIRACENEARSRLVRDNPDSDDNAGTSKFKRTKTTIGAMVPQTED